MISQLQVLNKILATKDFSLITAYNIPAEYFFNYKSEFNFIKNHYNTYKTVPDKLTFVQVFPDFEFQEVTEPDSYLIEQLAKDYNKAYLATSFNNIKQLLESEQIDKAINYFQDSAKNLVAAAPAKCVNLVSDTTRYDNFLEMAANKDKYFIPTGFKALDDIICGIDLLNENMVIAARTGKGKSWTLLKMAAAAAKAGKTVGIYSGEMHQDKVGYRLDTLLSADFVKSHELMTPIYNRAITHGDLSVQKDYKIYLETLHSKKGFGAIKVLTPEMLNGPATVDALRSFVENEHIEILFIDQYSLLEDTSRTIIAHERVANISKAIKNLQVMKRIPIISAAQMNRTKNEDESGSSVQDTTQIGLSDRIGQDATVVLMLDRKQIKDPSNPKAFPKDQLIINLVKVRDGGDGRKLTYDADFNTGVFNFVPENLDENQAKELKESYEINLNDDENPF